MASNPIRRPRSSPLSTRVLSGLRVACTPTQDAFRTAAEAARGSWLLSIAASSTGIALVVSVVSRLVGVPSDAAAATSTALSFALLLTAWAAAAQAIASRFASARVDLFEPLVFLSSTAQLAVFAIASVMAFLPAPWNGVSWLFLLYLVLLPVLATRAIARLSLPMAALVTLGATIVGTVAAFMVTRIIAGHQWIVEFGNLF